MLHPATTLTNRGLLLATRIELLNSEWGNVFTWCFRHGQMIQKEYGQQCTDAFISLQSVHELFTVRMWTLPSDSENVVQNPFLRYLEAYLRKSPFHKWVITRLQKNKNIKVLLFPKRLPCTRGMQVFTGKSYSDSDTAAYLSYVSSIVFTQGIPIPQMQVMCPKYTKINNNFEKQTKFCNVQPVTDKFVQNSSLSVTRFHRHYHWAKRSVHVFNSSPCCLISTKWTVILPVSSHSSCKIDTQCISRGTMRALFRCFILVRNPWQFIRNGMWARDWRLWVQ